MPVKPELAALGRVELPTGYGEDWGGGPVVVEPHGSVCVCERLSVGPGTADEELVNG